jgi:hypothetical protein
MCLLSVNGGRSPTRGAAVQSVLVLYLLVFGEHRVICVFVKVDGVYTMEGPYINIIHVWLEENKKKRNTTRQRNQVVDVIGGR